MIIYTDGHINGINNLLSKDKANSGYSILVINDKKIKIEYEKNNLTNSEAEIIAVIHAFFYAKRGDIIRTDSQFVFGSITKNWKIKEARIENLIAVAKSLYNLSGVKLEWVQRKENPAT